MSQTTIDRRLDDLPALVNFLFDGHKTLLEEGRSLQGGVHYCAPCGRLQRMTVQVQASVLLRVPRSELALAPGSPEYVKRLLPSVMQYSCLTCDNSFSAHLFQGPDGPTLAVFPRSYGGLTTPHTPKAVAYYLDQAQRALGAGAHSAAAAMYRAALEQLLFERGYQDGLLAKKLSNLEQHILAGTAPAGFKDIDTEFLNVIKELGNGAIHTNGGDITKQAALDRDLVIRVGETFAYLLFFVYEASQRRAAHLDALRIRAQVLRK